MPRLVAKDLPRYASRDLKPGDEFEATESDASILRSTGKAIDATPPAETTQMDQDWPDEHPDEDIPKNLFLGEQPLRRRRYRRRDMLAKD